MEGVTTRELFEGAVREAFEKCHSLNPKTDIKAVFHCNRLRLDLPYSLGKIDALKEIIRSLET